VLDVPQVQKILFFPNHLGVSLHPHCPFSKGKKDPILGLKELGRENHCLYPVFEVKIVRERWFLYLIGF
jgi:hypothetical protein